VVTQTRSATGAVHNLLAIGEELGHLDAEQLRLINSVMQQMRAVGLKAPIGQLLLEHKYVTPFQLKEMRQALVRRVANSAPPAESATAIMNFGAFEVLEMISEKPQSRVYKARDTRMNRTVALKMLPGEAMCDPQWAERFQREIEATGKLIHPNIATAYGCGNVDGRPFLVMEFVHGLSLSEKLEREGNLPERTAWSIAREMVKALAFADSMGVLHRNIKPDNIMLGDGGEIKLVDLGLSKLQSAAPGLTLEGATVGSPFYISPEQARGQSDLDIRSDLYSLGCTVFQMLTGATPFYSENFIEVMHMQAGAPRPDPRHILPEISHFSARLVMQMMALDREQRLRPDALLAEMNSVIEQCPEPEGHRPSLGVRLSDHTDAETALFDDLAPQRPLSRSRTNPPPESLLEAALELSLLLPEQADSLRELKAKLEQMGIDLPLGPALLGRGFLTPTQLERACALLRKRGFSRRPQGGALPSVPRIGNYELVRELAVGADSRVYLARDRAMRREVALRIVSQTSDAARLERFNREVQLLAQLTHPNIAAAYGAGEYKSAPYMATEYVDGISLAERLELEARLSERTAWRISREVAKGLAYASSCGILHRDIKPGNILCGYDGQIKIIDYGLSKSRDDRDSLTVQGTTVGTPYYMAPEQARGTTVVDGRSDIYALGCTVYQMLTGAVPFFRDQFFEVMQSHTKAPRPDARKLRPELTPDTARLVQRMMAIQVDIRPESEELITEIDKLLAILPDDAQGKPNAAPRRYKAPTSTMIPAITGIPNPPRTRTVMPPDAPTSVPATTHEAPTFRPSPKTSAFRKEELAPPPAESLWSRIKKLFS
jgi:serine/threonine protein kinase